MNIGASILIGKAIEDLRHEGIPTPPAPAAKALTSSDLLAELEAALRAAEEAKQWCLQNDEDGLADYWRGEIARFQKRIAVERGHSANDQAHRAL